MVSDLKTYGVLALFHVGNKPRHIRTIVATTDDKRASELMGNAIWAIAGRNWVESKDMNEVALTTMNPEVIFVEQGGRYIPLLEGRRQ